MGYLRSIPSGVMLSPFPWSMANPWPLPSFVHDSASGGGAPCSKVSIHGQTMNDGRLESRVGTASDVLLRFRVIQTCAAVASCTSAHWQSVGSGRECVLHRRVD